MSRGGYGSKDLSEGFQEVLSFCARGLMYLGGLASLISVGLLVFTCVRVNGDSVTPSQMADAVRNVDTFQKLLIVGALGLAIGTSYLFWGLELLGPVQLLLSAALYFAPLYLPGIVGDKSNEATKGAYGALQTGGIVLGIIGVIVIVADIAFRIKDRVKTGVKADHIKYGKGIKEEGDKQNVLLGKCWQLPYCRKFVRDRCPIFLTKRTCWKELVGCMCEEQVIRNAMENKPITKEAILSANFIPQNHKLSTAQKRERCFSCVIYNEHQRHKYKVAMPITVIVFGAVYAGGHGLLIQMVGSIFQKINDIVNKGTLGAAGHYQPPPFFVEAMLAVFMIIALTYAMKLLELVCFKLKV